MSSDDSEKKQEVTVTDIRMPFGSMVLFMVKWAVASIPALIILMLLGTVFWGIAIGVLSSVGTRPWSSALADAINKPPAQDAARADAAKLTAEERAYISKVQVYGLHAGGPVVENAVFGEIKNTGNHTLSNVEMIVYCLNSDGKPIFQKKFQLFHENQHASLECGGIKEFGVSMDDAPLEWKHNKLDVKVTQVKFE